MACGATSGNSVVVLADLSLPLLTGSALLQPLTSWGELSNTFVDFMEFPTFRQICNLIFIIYYKTI